MAVKRNFVNGIQERFRAPRQDGAGVPKNLRMAIHRLTPLSSACYAFDSWSLRKVPGDNVVLKQNDQVRMAYIAIGVGCP